MPQTRPRTGEFPSFPLSLFWAHGQCNIAYHGPYLRLIECLLPIMPHPSLESLFFVNSGSEAVEAALKMARSITRRQNIITMQVAYHRRIFGAMAIARSDAVFAEGLSPLMVRPSSRSSNGPLCLRRDGLLVGIMSAPLRERTSLSLSAPRFTSWNCCSLNSRHRRTPRRLSSSQCSARVAMSLLHRLSYKGCAPSAINIAYSSSLTRCSVDSEGQDVCSTSSIVG